MKRSAPMRRTPMRRAVPAPRPERERPALQLLPRNPDAPRGVMVRADAAAAPVPKEEIHVSEAWRRHVAGLPCVVCGAASQAAHRNEGKGMGLKTDDALTAALCPAHHAEIDQGRDMTREQRRAAIDRAIVLTLRALVRAGLVKAA